MQRSANKSRTQTMNQLRNLLVPVLMTCTTSSAPCRAAQLLTTCAAFRISADDDDLAGITRVATHELDELARTRTNSHGGSCRSTRS